MRAKLALFHGFDDSRNVFVKVLLHFRELRFEFFDAFLLALDPFGAQLFAFCFERVALGGHLLLQAVEFVAAAVQICDEVGGFARFRRQQFAGALDDGFCNS